MTSRWKTDRPMSRAEFDTRFPDRAACARYLAAKRWPDGFVCPACGVRRGWELETKPFTWECSGCHRQTSVTAGTVMHRQVAAADVVRGDPPAGEPFKRHFRRAGAGAIRHWQLQDGLAAAAQAAPGDGIAGPQLAAGHGGDRRDRSAVALEARPNQGLWHPECRQAADHWCGRTLPGRLPTAGAAGAVAGPHRRERPRLR